MTDKNQRQKKDIENTKAKVLAAIQEVKRTDGIHPVNMLADNLGYHLSKLMTILEELEVDKNPTVYAHIGGLAIQISLLKDTEVTGIKDFN